MLRVVFMGTPHFAAEILEHLYKWKDCQIVGVYTQPDRPAGRGMKTEFSEVKKFALEHDLPLYQPLNFKEKATRQELALLKPDVLAVAAYGLILPQEVLDIPSTSPLNVHASLLPKYRGAAPIQRAIMDGQQVTGISIMKMEKGLDTGPIFMQRALAIGVDDTSETLHNELASLGGKLLIEALQQIEKGTALVMPQDHDLASYAAKLSKEEGEIDFSRTAWEVHAHIRGVTPYPGAWFKIARAGGKRLRVLAEPGQMGPVLDTMPAHGSIMGIIGGSLAVACSDRLYLFPKLRPSTRHKMSAAAFVNGYITEKTNKGQPDFASLTILPPGTEED